MEPAGKRTLPSATSRSWLLAAGLLVAWAVTALAVLLPEPGSARYLAVHIVLLLAVLGLTAFGLVALAEARRRASADRELVREYRESEARSRLLTAQMPANVWTTDTELRLKKVFGAQALRLATSGGHAPDRTLYEIFGTTDPTHPAIAAHLRALCGDTARYERLAGDILLEVRVEPLRDDAGTVVGCVGVALDVTHGRASELHLRLLANAIESASDLISVTDAESRFVFVNEAFLRAYGYARQEVLGRTPALLEPSDDVRREILAATMQGGWTGDLVNHRKDGREFPVSLSTTVIRDSDGGILGLLGVARDISERKRADEALRKSNERFELAALATDEVICEWDFTTRTTWWSHSCERVLGYGPEAVRTDEAWWREKIHPDDRERVMLGWRQALGGRAQHWAEEFRFRHSDGEYAVVGGVGYIVRDATGKALRMIGALADVTFRKQAEVVEGRYQALVESSEDAILSTDLDGLVRSWNPAAERLYGYPAEQIIGRNIAVLEPPERAGEQATLRERLVRGERPPPYETTRRRRDGSIVEIATTLSPILDGEAKLVGVSAVVHDITERKRTEAALRRLAAIVESSDDAIMSTDTAHRILTWNAGAERLYGYAAAEVRGKSIDELISPPAAQAQLRRVREALGHGAAVARYEGTRVRKDGSLVEVAGATCAMRDASGALTGYSAVIRDITERKRTEEQLRESEEQLRALAGHLESAREEERARMARGIHDELGQMLTALRLDITWLARKLREPTPAVKRKIAEMIAMTDETIEAGRRIIADLRPPILDDLGLVPALQWYAEHLGKRAGLRIHLLTDGGEPKLDPRLAVAGYRIVQEALTNVVRHAQARNVEVRVGSGGGSLVIEVRDDGCGVSPAVASDPRSFGIAGMRERARSSGGALEISGAPGAGTLVRFAIPIERRLAAREPA